MDIALVGSLAALALIDSTSFGTLLIPIWLLLHPGRIRVGRMLVFLDTVATFYFLVGVGLTLGLSAAMPRIKEFLDTDAALWTQLVIGVGLFVWSFRLGGKHKRDSSGGRVARWRERALGEGRIGSLIGLALTATTLEVGTMVPYLAAIGILTNADLPFGQNLLILGGYCLVMILPALVLLVLRLTTGRRIEPLLTRVSNWMTNGETISWIVGIVGFVLALDAIGRLKLFEFV